MVGISGSAKRIHLTRHAQAEHNVASDWNILDAPLTDLGREQCRELNKMTETTIQKSAEFLVSSPLRRTMETTLVGYPHLQERLAAKGKPVYLLDLLQEVNSMPCDTPLHPVEKLKSSNGGIFGSLDFSTLSPEYASKKGIFSPDQVLERAKKVRHWLRERPEGEIVVVAHGDILRTLVDGPHSRRPWANAEIKIFTFISSDDSEAALTEIDSIEPRKATNDPTTGEMK